MYFEPFWERNAVNTGVPCPKVPMHRKLGLQRLDRLLDWHTTHRQRPTTRNAALRAALGDWLDQQEQLAGLLDSQVLRQQFHAAYTSLRPSATGVPIYRLRRVLQWPRERFDTVLETLRAAQVIEVEARTEPVGNDPATHDSYQVHGQYYDRLRWRP
jgi:hypothetical protein